MINKERLNALKEALIPGLQEVDETHLIHSLYLVISVLSNDHWIDYLDDHDDHYLQKVIYMGESTLYEYLEDNYQHGFKKEDDLFPIIIEVTNHVYKSLNMDPSDEDFVFAHTVLFAGFRLWYEKKTKKDLLFWLDHPNSDCMPDTTDYSYHVKWATEQGLRCTDINALAEQAINHKQSADEEIESLHMMADLKKLFTGVVDALKPSKLKTFIQENDKSCFLLFSTMTSSLMVFRTKEDIKEITSDEKSFNSFYNSFHDFLKKSPVLKVELSNPKKADDYKEVAKLSLYIMDKILMKDGATFEGKDREEYLNTLTKERIDRIEHGKK